MNTLREYVTVRPCPITRSRDASSSRSWRCSPRAPRSAVTSSTDRALPASARARARRTAWGVGSDMTFGAYYGSADAPARPGVSPAPPARRLSAVNVVALAGGIGAGKFLRGLVRAVPPRNVTVVVNTADDIELHGLHVSPDLDSVTYWLGTVMDRERGWLLVRSGGPGPRHPPVPDRAPALRRHAVRGHGPGGGPVRAGQPNPADV